MHAVTVKSNWGDVRGSRAIRIWSYTGAAVAMLILAGLRMDTLTWGAVGIMSALGIATSLFSFRLDERTTVSFGPAVFMAAVALFGALVAVWVAAISGLLLEMVRFRRGGAPALARVGVRVIGVLAAAGVYWAIGGVISPSKLELLDVAKFLAMFGTFSTVTGVFEASLEDPGSGRFKRYFRWLSGRGVVVELAMLPLSLLLVAAYIPNEPTAFPLLAVVLMISSAAGQKLWDTQQSLLSRVSELKTLNTVGSALACAVRIDELVRLVHVNTKDQLGTPILSVTLFDEEKGSLEFRTCALDDCGIAPQTTALGESFTAWVANNREPLNVPDILVEDGLRLAAPISACAEEKGIQVRSWLGVPLVAADRLVGVLSIMSERTEAFDGPTVELVTTIGTQVGKVVNAARLYEQLERARYSAESRGKQLAVKVDERTSELTETREELKALNEDLERRVEERTQELKDMQTRIVQSGRLAAVGELSAGVAHELNNPIAGILGYAQYDLEALADSTAATLTDEDLVKLREHLTFIERGARRCTDIVESLVRFAETSRCASSEIKINELVLETLGFTERELSSRGIQLETSLSRSDMEVVGDPRQLQQVFANIILNARKAMQSGGRLSVTSSRVEREDGLGQAVAVSFADTGCGISDENLIRVFEPFYTTNEVGDGSGLGLSVSYGIIKDHGGDIDVVSKPGVGSTFTVLLPLSAECGSEQAHEREASSGSA